MAALKPEFTDSFLVADKKNNYGDFIRIVRQHVIKYCKDRRPGIDEPVLPPEKKVPDLWFHIALYTKQSSLKLAIRMDNLYLVGFKNTAGDWWEFNNDDGTHLIPGAKWLGFGGSYLDLIGKHGKLEDVKLGRAKMEHAVDGLAKYSGEQGVLLEQQLLGAGHHKGAKEDLARLVIMLCEGLRFLTVSDTVDKKFDHHLKAATITELEGKQVRKWEKISEAVFTWADDPTAKFPELEEIGIKNKNDAAKVVALVKDIPPK